MTLLIAGDSYSTDQDFRVQPVSSEHYSWVNEIKKRYPFVVKGVAGASNWDILHQLDCEYSYAIVGLTGINRVSHTQAHQTETWKQDNKLLQKVREAGRQYARKILAHPRCYIWSRWPVYETWPGVDYIELRTCDEFWNEAITPRVTGNHLTREGNDWMINYMTRIIEERL
jgi:hypothetical protein